MNEKPPINSGESAPDDSANPWTKEGLFDDVEFVPAKTVDLSKAVANDQCKILLDVMEKYNHTASRVTEYLNEMINKDAKQYESPEDFLESNPGYMEKIHALPYNKKDVLNMYTGMEYKYFNVLSRMSWDYEILGTENEAIKKKFKEEYIPQLTSAIMNAPTPTEDFVTFRGANIDSFVGYGLYNEPTVENLKKLKGQLYYNKSFMSTSLTEEASFVNRELDDQLRDNCTLEIRYHIPAGSHDSAALLSNELSTAVGQQEVVIKNNTLNYVSDVSESENGKPIIDMIMIPLELWNPQDAEHYTNL